MTRVQLGWQLPGGGDPHPVPCWASERHLTEASSLWDKESPHYPFPVLTTKCTGHWAHKGPLARKGERVGRSGVRDTL